MRAHSNVYSTVGIAIMFSLVMEVSALATTYVPKPRPEIMAKSVFIGRVKIVEGKQMTVSFENQERSCGGIYRASVEDALLGEMAEVEFLDKLPLKIGQSYLVFLTNDRDSRGMNLGSTNSYALEHLRIEAATRKLCEEEYKGQKAIGDYTSEFTAYREIKVDERSEVETWLDFNPFAESEDNDVSIIGIDALTFRLRKADDWITITDDDWYDAKNKDGSHRYPYYDFHKELVGWDDLKAAILQHVKKKKQ